MLLLCPPVYDDYQIYSVFCLIEIIICPQSMLLDLVVFIHPYSKFDYLLFIKPVSRNLSSLAKLNTKAVVQHETPQTLCKQTVNKQNIYHLYCNVDKYKTMNYNVILPALIFELIYSLSCLLVFQYICNTCSWLFRLHRRGYYQLIPKEYNLHAQSNWHIIVHLHCYFIIQNVRSDSVPYILFIRTEYTTRCFV